MRQPDSHLVALEIVYRVLRLFDLDWLGACRNTNPLRFILQVKLREPNRLLLGYVVFLEVVDAEPELYLEELSSLVA
jgi:hypothetical protein